MEVETEVRATPSGLYTSNRVLDNLLGGFHPGQIVFLNSASSFVHTLVFLLSVRHILDFDRDVIFVDGGNSINPYTIASIAKRYGRHRQEILGHIRVARAFTAYQMATILLESLEDEVRAGPGLLVLSCLGDLFLDEDMEYREAYHLLRQGLKKVRDLVREEELIGVVTNQGLSQLSRRRGIGNLLHQMADRVVRIQQGKGGLLILLSKEGIGTPFIPVPPNQSILEDYTPFPLPLREFRLEPLQGPGNRRSTRQVEISSFR